MSCLPTILSPLLKLGILVMLGWWLVQARNGGLTSQEAAMRLLKFGRNLLTPGDSGKGIRLFSHISLTASFLSAMYAALQCEGGLSSGEQQTTWLATLMPALALKAMLLCYARNLV